MKVVVRLVNRDARPFPRFVSGPGDGGIVFEIGDLLGGAVARKDPEDDNDERNSLNHVLSQLKTT
jgi:hypothetical protein